jgi:hypothetical protein
MAITKYEQFDFLIDIVPREESKPHRKHVNSKKKSKENSLSLFRIIIWVKYNILLHFHRQTSLVLYNCQVMNYLYIYFSLPYYN